MGVDPYGLKSFEELADTSYEIGVDGPEDATFKYVWGREKPTWRQRLWAFGVRARARGLIIGGGLVAPTAARALGNYLTNTGNEFRIYFSHMLYASRDAREIGRAHV